MNIRDLEGFLFSRLAHIEREKKAKPDFKGNPLWDTTEEAVNNWIKRRNDYHLFVLSYFSERPADFLIVNFIRDESAATKVCSFLGYAGAYDRPKANTNPRKDRPAEHIAMVKNCIADLGLTEQELDFDIYCPSIENEEIQSRFPPDSSMLKEA